MTELIRLESVGVEYRVHGHAPKKVLDNLNLTIHAGEFVARGFCKSRCERLLGSTEDIHRKMAGILKNGKALREHAKAPQHQWRVQ